VPIHPSVLPPPLVAWPEVRPWVHLLGSASKVAGGSLMGGDFFFGGLTFDPYDHLDPHQVADGKELAIAPENFKLIVARGGLRGYESH